MEPLTMEELQQQTIIELQTANQHMAVLNNQAEFQIKATTMMNTLVMTLLIMVLLQRKVRDWIG